MVSLTEALLYLFIPGIGIAIYFLLGRKTKNYPPGLIRYPIIGNILSFGNNDFHNYFNKHAEKYGPICSVKLGLQDAIVLNDVKLINEAFNENDFTGRPPSAILDFLAGRNDGIVQSNGRTWVEQRRFALRTLRDFGFGRKGMEALILDEVQDLMNWIGKQDGKPVHLHRRILLAVVNSLWTILTGQRHDHDDKKLVKISEELELAANELLKGKGMSLLLAYYPKLAELIPNLSGWNYVKSLAKVRQDLFDGIIEEHRQTHSEDHPRDFIDVYISEVNKTEDPDSSFHPSTAYKSLQSVMSDFFLAGSDTTSTTIGWAILYLIHNPVVLKKMQEEIDIVVGGSKLPSLTDRKSLPYTEAFIMEVLRSTSSSYIPLGVHHYTTENVHFHGYDIPKGTTVMSNIYYVHHDPKIWGDPYVFRPERFLSKDGGTVQKHECFIPFSVGKRTCLGMNLAQDKAFLFITCLVQRFDITSESGKDKPTLEPHLGQITFSAQPYSVVMTERQ